jgi:hypothetical protein
MEIVSPPPSQRYIKIHTSFPTQGLPRIPTLKVIGIYLAEAAYQLRKLFNFLTEERPRPKLKQNR